MINITKKIPILSVFTPAYNRVHTIERTYKSLCSQSSHNFQWILVDDGSVDNMRQVVETWFSTKNLHITATEIVGYSKDAEWLRIHYVYKENGGMHTAHNEAYKHIDTELAVCIDSDDWMPENGVELIIAKWRKEGGERYAGIIGLDVFEDGFIVGDPFPKDLHSCKTYELEYKYKVKWDKKYVYRTDVIKKHLPYYVYPGERYGGVNYLYQVIDKDYDMLCSNEVYCIVDYQPDGLTFNVLYQHKQSPNTRAYESNVLLESVPYFKERVKRAIQYDSSLIFAHTYWKILASNKPLLTFLALPFAIVYNCILRISKSKKIDLNSAKIVLHKDLQ